MKLEHLSGAYQPDGLRNPDKMNRGHFFARALTRFSTREAEGVGQSAEPGTPDLKPLLAATVSARIAYWDASQAHVTLCSHRSLYSRAKGLY